MPQDSLFAGIDIGSSRVRVAVGQRLPVGDKETVHIIGAAETESEGIVRGVITSIEDAVSAVSACIERVERMAGAPVGTAWVGISGAHASSMVSKGVVGVSRPDGEIREEDVERALDQAQTVASPVNYEILHVIPKTYTVDGQGGIKDPVGMTGIRLEVDAQIIQGHTSHIKNLTRCVYRTGANIEQLVLGVLAAAEVVTTPRQKELGVAVANIGGSSTSVIVFEQGEIMHLATVPIGADHVTADIAIGLRTSIDIAEKVKVKYALASAKDIDKKEEINLRELGADIDEMVSRRYVSQIVQARLEELLEKLDKELKKIDRSGMLPAGVVLTGGGAKIPGIVDLAKHKLRLPVSLGYPIGVTSITDRVSDISFTTAIGLVQWGINDTAESSKRQGGMMVKMGNPMGKIAQGIKKLFGAKAR
jgi:cell division protein FtsA